MFPVGATTWTMNNTMLLNMKQDSLQLGIKLPYDPDVNIIIASPYKANVLIGMQLNYCIIIMIQIFSETLNPTINLLDYTPLKVAFSNDAVMLSCFANGRSKINYHWEHRVNSSNSWTMISAEMDTGLFILSSVTEDDEGIYRCVACDCYSCSYSIKTTTVIVIGKGVIIYVHDCL